MMREIKLRVGHFRKSFKYLQAKGMYTTVIQKKRFQ